MIVRARKVLLLVHLDELCKGDLLVRVRVVHHEIGDTRLRAPLRASPGVSVVYVSEAIQLRMRRDFQCGTCHGRGSVGSHSASCSRAAQWKICGVGVCTIFAHLEVKFAEAAEEDLHALVHVDGSALILVVHHEL